MGASIAEGGLLKPQLRLEWQDQDGQNEKEQPYQSASLGDSIAASRRIGFSVHTRVLRVRTQREGDHKAIAVLVQDTGPGITPEKLESIFDAFVTTTSHGMGLGLAISRMIVERHGGQLSARSDEEKGGAVFQLTLPFLAYS